MARTPDAIAVVFEQESLSYAELNARANQLAHYLKRQGVGPEVVVGLCIERSLDMLIGLLGVLKAGGAYLPLDPEYPTERLEYMMADVGVGLLLTHSSLSKALSILGKKKRVLLDHENVLKESNTLPSLCLHSENVAYIIFTSGSTGKPKGAANTHNALYNRLSWMQRAYHLTAEDAVLQKTPFSFDVSVWEFFWPLITGARLVLAAPGAHHNPAQLVELIKAQGITTLHFVPSMLQAFIEHPGVEVCQGIRRLICSGEALSADLQAQVSKRAAQYSN